MIKPPYDRLCRRLGYTFRRHDYLLKALTHCSVGENNNERFEFLGDSLLSCVIAHALFERYQASPEGDLSRLRAYLVKGERLAEIAKELELGDYLNLSQSELRSGGFRRASILSDALEAIFAAIFLDGGFDACQAVILNLYNSRLDDKALMTTTKDAKTELQEHIQALKESLPEYHLIKTEGDEHNLRFIVQCAIKSLNVSAEAEGASRKKAEQAAAGAVLKMLVS